jgi:cellulose synthase/poly-beta-1,6-N-acetylglucosamine synthase-like glycosyltransferase
MLAIELRNDQSPPPIFRDAPLVSILVAAWNEAGIIQQHINSVQRLRYPNKELVLCAGGTDGTFEIARDCTSMDENVILLQQKQGDGKQRALRQCFERARGAIIYLTDADCILDDSAFERAIAPVVNEGVCVTTGTSQPLEHQRSDSFVVHLWFVDNYGRAHWGDSVTGLLGRNSAITRSALQAIDAFDDDVTTGTDYYMAKKLLEHGYSIRYVGRSCISTSFAQSLAKYRAQQTRWLRNVVILGLNFHAHNEVFQALTPSILGWGMIVGTVISLFGGPFLQAVMALSWLYVLLSRVRYMRFGELVTSHRFSRGYIFLPFYVLVDLVIWALTLVQYPHRRLRRQW